MYICNECQETYKKWYGQCPKCKSWNSIEKGEAVSPKSSKTAVAKQTVSLNDIDASTIPRMNSGIAQLDLVLGGGFVPGSLTLLGGRPGIGKSTLILKLADHMAKDKRVLYVSGEENLGQIKLRANRLGVTGDIRFLNEQDSHNIIETSLHTKAQFVIVDSIQTTASPNHNGASGSVSQLKAIALEMMEFAKQNNITVVLIGHVTKDGDIAGPKLLEHMVDTVLYMESDNYSDVRILRSEKNRFGTTNEVGMLKMEKEGLVTYDTNKLLKSRPNIKAEGTAMSASKVGGRNVFIEVQSLVTPTAYPSPKRSSQGIELSRLNIMLAILQKHMHIMLNYDDVYLKLRGNIKGIETGIDLGLIASLYSAKMEFPISNDILFLGEVTLTGEVLSSPENNELIETALKLGYKHIYCNSTINKEFITNVKHIREVLESIRS